MGYDRLTTTTSGSEDGDPNHHADPASGSEDGDPYNRSRDGNPYDLPPSDQKDGDYEDRNPSDTETSTSIYSCNLEFWEPFVHITLGILCTCHHLPRWNICV